MSEQDALTVDLTADKARATLMDLKAHREARFEQGRRLDAEIQRLVAEMRKAERDCLDMDAKIAALTALLES